MDNTQLNSPGFSPGRVRSWFMTLDPCFGRGFTLPLSLPGSPWAPESVGSEVGGALDFFHCLWAIKKLHTNKSAKRGAQGTTTTPKWCSPELSDLQKHMFSLVKQLFLKSPQNRSWRSFVPSLVVPERILVHLATPFGRQNRPKSIG